MQGCSSPPRSWSCDAEDGMHGFHLHSHSRHRGRSGFANTLQGFPHVAVQLHIGCHCLLYMSDGCGCAQVGMPSCTMLPQLKRLWNRQLLLQIVAQLLACVWTALKMLYDCLPSISATPPAECPKNSLWPGRTWHPHRDSCVHQCVSKLSASPCPASPPQPRAPRAGEGHSPSMPVSLDSLDPQASKASTAPWPGRA